MTRASDLIEQGRYQEVWQQFCGFLDLTMPEFKGIQERLLLEQLGRINGSVVGRALLGDKVIDSVASFREQVPLTTYEDYAAWMDEKREDILPEKPVDWVHTSGRSGGHKWAPLAPDAFRKLGEVTLAAFLLSTARQRGEVRLRRGDVLMYNTPPRPYTSAYLIRAIIEWFDFKLTPPLAVAENLDFQGRVELSFKMALQTGMDVTASLSSVLMRIGERFVQGGSTMSFSRDLLHPAVLARLLRALVISKLQKRPMLPRDLWKLKGAMAGGMDTAIYRGKLTEYWGIDVHESYACTEGGMLATQAWDRRGMYFYPDVAFFEFIPEQEWERWREDNSYRPRTVLIDEVQPGCLYEVVITNFHGGAFLRYRMHDLIAFAPPNEREPGIPMPSFFFKGRSADVIDLAGFTGIIDEKSLWQALIETGFKLVDWSVRKEVAEDRPVLHVYVEFAEPVETAEVRSRLDKILRAGNPFYADIHSILGYDPLRVTVLPTGTFGKYMRQQQEAGADLAHLKPSHMNAADRVIGQLLALAEQ